MNNVKRGLATAVIVLGIVATASQPSNASLVSFIPPNDTTGAVYSTNSNDGYADGRGDVFGMTGNATIDSVGIYLDVTDASVTYKILQVTSTTGDVDAGATLLATGTSAVSTSGLQFVDFSIAPLTLLAGNDYHIEFSYAENGNQNFFFNNENVPFTNGFFSLIDGTQAGDASNFVMPYIHVNVVESVATPEPSTLAIAVSCLIPVGMLARRRATRRPADVRA